MLVDFVVHGIGRHTNCDFYSLFDARKKLIIEFEDGVNGLKDYSLSRCLSNNESSFGFNPTQFHMVSPTPGAPNSCNETKLVNQAFYVFDCDINPLDTAQLEVEDDNRRCNVLINELNTGSPGILQNRDFIELFAYCPGQQPKTRSLQGYKLIGISAGSGRSDGMLIDLVINLWNSKWAENKFFTIGTPEIPNTQLTTESSYVVYRNKFSGSSSQNQRLMLTGNRHLHAIALLYKESYNFPEIVLNVKNQYIIIDDKLKEVIKKNLVDMVVYGRKAPYDNCKLFTDLYNEYTNKDYILREFDNNEVGLDRTLNRCADSPNTFVPEHFKLGTPTPGAINDCTGPHFIIEPHLPEISNALEVSPFDSETMDSNQRSLMQDDGSQCTRSIDLSAYASTSTANINNEINRENSLAQSDTCTSLNLGADDGNIGEELDTANRRKRRLSDTHDYEVELEWETTKYFQ